MRWAFAANVILLAAMTLACGGSDSDPETGRPILQGAERVDLAPPTLPCDLMASSAKLPLDLVVVADDSISAEPLREQTIALAEALVEHVQPGDRITAFWMNAGGAWLSDTVPDARETMPTAIPVAPTPHPSLFDKNGRPPAVGGADESVEEQQQKNQLLEDFKNRRKAYEEQAEAYCKAQREALSRIDDWRRAAAERVHATDPDVVPLSPVVEAIGRGRASFGPSAPARRILIVTGDAEPFRGANELPDGLLDQVDVIVAPFRPDEHGWETATQVVGDWFRGAGATSVQFVSADRPSADVIELLKKIREAQ